MPTEFNISRTATLIGDPTRSLMLTSLVDGRALTAGELSTVAGISPSTASEHLAKLRAGGLLRVERQGRHRYFRLADENVGAALEALMRISPRQDVRKVVPRVQKELIHARSCYDHLAGKVAVAITDALVDQGYLALADSDFNVTAAGRTFFDDFGIDLTALREKKRHFARPCLDWSERRYHLAGALGAGILETCLTRKWLRRKADSRASHVTPRGTRELDRHLQISSFLG